MWDRLEQARAKATPGPWEVYPWAIGAPGSGKLGGVRHAPDPDRFPWPVHSSRIEDAEWIALVADPELSRLVIDVLRKAIRYRDCENEFAEVGSGYCEEWGDALDNAVDVLRAELERRLG